MTEAETLEKTRKGFKRFPKEEKRTLNPTEQINRK
jgi:hypothetical protein